MSSIRTSIRKDGSVSVQVLWREYDPAKGRNAQTGMTFDDPAAAERFKGVLDKHGPEAARKYIDTITGIAEGGSGPALVTLNNNFAETYISGLTGASKAQKDRYRAYMRNDFADYLGDLPLEALCAANHDQNSIVQDWVNDEEADGASGKTIANKHGFLSAMLKVAVRRRLMSFNPCEDSVLPPRHYEPTFLETDEFDILLDMAPERWKPLIMFLVSSGVRWSEATALRVGDFRTIKGERGAPDTYTARVSRAWKYTGTARQEIGGPKTRKGIRTINIPPEAIEYLDLNRSSKELLFHTQDGNRISSQLFRNRCWKDLVDAAEKKIGKRPRPHDLRHTCASWMINGGAELADVQAHLGHEKISTTMDIYGHLDRRSGLRAANALSKALGGI